MLKAILLLCLFSLALAIEKSQCEIKNNIDDEDWKTLNADPTKPSEEMLCLFKCLYRENGSTNSDGTINAEKMIENIDKWKTLTEDSKNYIRDCLKDLGPVKTCADVNPSFRCAHQALEKQKRVSA